MADAVASRNVVGCGVGPNSSAASFLNSQRLVVAKRVTGINAAMRAARIKVVLAMPVGDFFDFSSRGIARFDGSRRNETGQEK